jgi:hypothetical protein
MAERLGRATVVADGSMDGGQCVVAAVGVPDQGGEKHRVCLFNLLEDLCLARWIQFYKRHPVVAFTADGDLDEPVEEHSAQPGRPSHGAFDTGTDIEVARAGQILTRWHEAVEHRREERALSFI